nr:MAG TPA: hypothetical protein [Bacteriophage sp.]
MFFPPLKSKGCCLDQNHIYFRVTTVVIAT